MARKKILPFETLPQEDSDEQIARDLADVLLRAIRKLAPRPTPTRSEFVADHRDRIPKGGGMPLAPKLLFTRRETAETLSLSVSSVQELMHMGLLNGVRKGQRLMIHRDEIERFSKADVTTIWGPKHNGKTTRVHALKSPQSESMR